LCFTFENVIFREQISRHLYYLQLRKDVLEGNVYVHEDTALLLASYALQAEINDHNSGGPSSLYFAPEKYLPQRVGVTDLTHRVDRSKYYYQLSELTFSLSRLLWNWHLSKYVINFQRCITLIVAWQTPRQKLNSWR
jgi:hypothetical protein